MRPEVAAQFELTSHVTRVHVARLGREYDLTQVSVEQAEQLLAAGCTRLRRKEVSYKEVPVNDAGPVARTTGPTKGKKKKGA